MIRREWESVVFHPLREDFPSEYVFRARFFAFSLSLTSPSGREYIPAVVKRGDSSAGVGIRGVSEKANSYPCPIWQANRVDFGERLGFLRIVRAAHIPIVPLGIRGSHFTAPLFFRSRTLATLLVQPRVIGVKRWGISLLGLIVAALLAVFAPLPWPVRIGLVWFWLGTPFVFLPWVPWTIRMRIGEPIEASTLFAPEGTTETKAELMEALRHVEGAVQALVDRSESEHHEPRPTKNRK